MLINTILISSAINPILYNAMSDKFRKAFRTFLVCCDVKRNIQNQFVDEPLMVGSIFYILQGLGAINREIKAYLIFSSDLFFS